MSYTSKQYIEVISVNGYSETEIQFEMNCVSPGRPAVMYLRNGDPGYPAENAEFEVSAIFTVNGEVSLEISDTILETICGSEVYANILQMAFEDAQENYEE
jgi:hypothetical protein